MKNQTILFSTPNSGSDWLASIIIAGDNKIKYFREFFNPITNDKYTDELAKGFGCEFISTYKNIARLDNSVCEKIYKNTWEKEKFNFTKENYSVFKIPFFVEKFNCIGLIRKIENSFPPSRKNEVYWWYDCIYNSMLANFETLPPKTKIKLEISEKTLSSIEHKILMCHYIYQETLIDQCQEYGIPIIEWENLVGSTKKINTELAKIPLNLNLEAAINSVISTKKYVAKKFNKYNFHPKIHLTKEKTLKLL